MAAYSEYVHSYEPKESTGPPPPRIHVKVSITHFTFSIQLYTQTQDTLNKTQAAMIH